MLGISILQKNIQKELQQTIKNLLSILLIQKKLHKKIKSSLVILIMMRLSFLSKKKILARMKKRTMFVFMCLVMKLSWFFQFTFQIKNLKTQWICYFWLMMINRIVCILKILTDLCLSKQKIKTKNSFARVVYSVLVVKMYWQNIKMIVWALMVNNL